MKQAATKSNSKSASTSISKSVSTRRRSTTRNTTKNRISNTTATNNNIKNNNNNGDSREMISSNLVMNQSGTGGNFVQRIRTPHTHDVLSGRGGGINSHVGNRRFREWVSERKEDYNLAGSKAEKARVANYVIDLVRSQTPPGRFLQRDQAMSTSSSSWWTEVDQTRALAKTSQALREGAPQIRTAHKSELEERAHLKQKRRSHHSISHATTATGTGSSAEISSNSNSHIQNNKRRKLETDYTATVAATATAVTAAVTSTTTTIGSTTVTQPSLTITTALSTPAMPVITSNNNNNIQALESLQHNVLAAKALKDAQQQQEDQEQEQEEQQQELSVNAAAAAAAANNNSNNPHGLESLQQNILAAKALKDVQQQQADQEQEQQQQQVLIEQQSSSLPFIAPPLLSNKDFEERYYLSSSSIPAARVPQQTIIDDTMDSTTPISPFMNDHTETPPLTSTPGENMILPPPLNLNKNNNYSKNDNNNNNNNNSKTSTSGNGNGSGGHLSRSHSLAFSDISGLGYMFPIDDDDDVAKDFVNPFADESDIVNYMDFAAEQQDYHHPYSQLQQQQHSTTNITNGSDFGEGMKTVLDAVHPGVTSPDNGKDDWIPTLLMPWRGSGSSLLPRRSNSGLSPRTSKKPAARRGSASGRQ